MQYILIVLVFFFEAGVHPPILLHPDIMPRPDLGRRVHLRRIELLHAHVDAGARVPVVPTVGSGRGGQQEEKDG